MEFHPCLRDDGAVSRPRHSRIPRNLSQSRLRGGSPVRKVECIEKIDCPMPAVDRLDTAIHKSCAVKKIRPARARKLELSGMATDNQCSVPQETLRPRNSPLPSRERLRAQRGGRGGGAAGACYAGVTLSPTPPPSRGRGPGAIRAPVSTHRNATPVAFETVAGDRIAGRAVRELGCIAAGSPRPGPALRFQVHSPILRQGRYRIRAIQG
jgi:hypothetical protein